MTSDGSQSVEYVRKNFDVVAILAVAAKLALESEPKFSDSELATIAAMMRAHPSAGGSSADLGQWLTKMDDDQIQGVVSNTKGVLHEMEFVKMENEDGDLVYASLYESPNHPGYDVQFIDSETGAHWDVQLKATDSASYVREWMDDHPDGEIIVTEELADALDLKGSGVSNQELTARSEEVVDKLLDAADDDDLWSYLPGLAVVSIGIVIWDLWGRYRKGEISLARFKFLAAKTTGLKTSKLALLTLALSVPGLNVVTGAALVVGLSYSGASVLRSISEPTQSNEL